MLEVWLDCDLRPPSWVGTLRQERGQICFHYARNWQQDPHAFALDPGLPREASPPSSFDTRLLNATSFDAAPLFPNPARGNFGIFLDASPYRWGESLMQRQEALRAKDKKQRPRPLHAWDFLIGAQDFTRQGALRFRLAGTDAFLAHEASAAPPLTLLGTLEAAAYFLTNRHIKDLDALREPLTRLIPAGATLGGARPKANFTQADGSLWIGKFPAEGDGRDMGAWEYLAHTLACKAGITVPRAKLVSLNHAFRTFCVQRFDRVAGKRRFYASAMTLLHKQRSKGTSYLELAQFIRRQGSTCHVDADLQQLFRRVAFNVAIGNRDDHLHNLGFILEDTGWRLAPAFDLNPNPHKTGHALYIDPSDNRPNLDTVRDTAPAYGLHDAPARQILEEVATAIDGWQAAAHSLHIAGAEINLTANAFSAHSAFRSRQKASLN